MADDGTVRIGLEIDSSKAKTQAKKEATDTGKQVGANLSSGVEDAAGSTGTKAGSAIKSNAVAASSGTGEAVGSSIANSSGAMSAAGAQAGNAAGSSIRTGVLSKLSGITDDLGSIGSTMSLAITAPILAIGTASFKTSMDFDTSMSQLAGALNEPIDSIGELRQLAIQTGQDTIYSSSEAGSAMIELAKGGLTEAQIEGGALASTMQLASAGNIELSDSANTVVRAMGAFHLSASDTESAVNALAGSANASSADVSDVSMALSQASAQAYSAGWSIQDTTAAIAELADSGIKGSDAGTSLKTMLQSLQAPSDTAAKTIEQLGLQVRDADGNMRPATEIVGELQTKLGGLSSAQRDAALQTIFGSDASRASLVLMSGGVEGYQKYTEATNDQTAAQRMADAQMGNSQKAIENAKGAIETAAISLGGALSPAVEHAADVVGDLSSDFSNIPDDARQTIISMALVAASMGPAAKGISSVIGFAGDIGKMSDKMDDLASGSKLAAAGMTAFKSAIILTAVVGAVYELSVLGNQLSSTYQNAMASGNALSSAADSISSFAEKSKDAASSVADVNGLLTSSGSTIGGVTQIITDDENAITAILAKSFGNQKQLRDEDIAAIQAYNQQIQDLEGQKVQAYQAGIAGVADSVTAEGTITTDQAAADLATVQDYHSKSLADLTSYHNSRLQTLNQEYSVEGILTYQQYQDALKNENDYYNKSKSNLDSAAGSATATIANSVASATSIDQSTIDSISKTKGYLDNIVRVGDVQAGFAVYLNSDTGAVKRNARELSDALTSLATQSNADFVAAQMNIVATGGTISKENRSNLNNILDAFSNLPPELGDTGTKAMRALAAGLDSELGIDVANSSADQIIAAYRSKIGDAGTAGHDTTASWYNGMDEEKQTAINKAIEVSGLTLDQFKASADQAGQSGSDAVIAYADSISNGGPASVLAANNVAYSTEGGLHVTDGSQAGQTFIDTFNASMANGDTYTDAMQKAQQAAFGLNTADTGSVGVGYITNLNGGMNSQSSNLDATSSGLAEVAKRPLYGLQDQSYGWGNDLIQGLGNGMHDMLGWLSDRAYEAANVINAPLHQSTADVGPLKYTDQWGGDLIRNIIDDMASMDDALGIQSAKSAAIITSGFSPLQGLGFTVSGQSAVNYSMMYNQSMADSGTYAALNDLAQRFDRWTDSLPATIKQNAGLSGRDFARAVSGVIR